MVDMHSTIKKVSEDYEKMKYNTAIAALMTLVNTMSQKGQVTAGELKALLLLLSPVAPHICEEIWEMQGFGTPVYTQPWPSYDEKYLIHPQVEIAVQINGKVRGKMMVDSDLSREDGERDLPQHADVQALVGDKQVVKAVFVPGRLLNLVVTIIRGVVSTSEMMGIIIK
jgi:leucyl-tRNA synthetase